jgi:hypothetical protein
VRIGAAGGDRLVLRCGSSKIYERGVEELARLMKLEL